MEDFQLDNLVFNPSYYKDHIHQLNHEAIRPIAEAFGRNMTRMASLSDCVFQAVEVALRYQSRSDTARLAIFGHLDPIDLPDDHPQMEAFLEVIEALKQTPSVFQLQFPPLVMGKTFVSEFLKEHDSFLPQGLKAILAAQLVGAWTAYETLMRDLWVVSLNEKPIPLALNALGLNRQSKSQRASKGSFDYEVLARCDFNLSGQMGTILADSKEFCFERVDGIRAAYEKVFGEQIAEGFERAKRDGGKEHIEQWKDAHEKGLVALEALRNVIVHNGGVADKRFLEKVAKDPRYNSLKRGDEVPISGGLVSELSQFAANRCMQMIGIVDTVLIS